MPIYSKDSKGLLLDLVRQSNQSLPAELSADEFNLSAPVLTSTSSFAKTNTEIWLFPKATGRFKGNIKVAYFRLKLDTLFRSNTPVIWKYTDKAANQSPFTIYQLLPYLNEIYGTNLTTDDVYDASLPVGDTTTTGYIGIRTSAVIVRAKESSVGYTGTFTLRWAYTKLTLNDVAPLAETDGRVYPGGNDFANNHAYVLNSVSRGIPFDSMSSHLLKAGAFDGTTTLGTPAQLAEQQPVIDYLNSIAGTAFTIDQADADTPFSLYGATTQLLTLPAAAYPQADSEYFTNAVVITPSASHPLANVVGEMILHFNT
jgi:hypothetical protein